jgi:hypothetical protein
VGSALFLTIVFIVDSTVADLVAIATHVSLLAFTGVRMSIFRIFFFFGSFIVMNNISQPQIEVQLLASVIHSRFLNKANTVICVELGGHWVTVKNRNHKEAI